jgi:hypothetical protein
MEIRMVVADFVELLPVCSSLSALAPSVLFYLISIGLAVTNSCIQEHLEDESKNSRKKRAENSPCHGAHSDKYCNPLEAFERKFIEGKMIANRNNYTEQDGSK